MLAEAGSNVEMEPAAVRASSVPAPTFAAVDTERELAVGCAASSAFNCTKKFEIEAASTRPAGAGWKDGGVGAGVAAGGGWRREEGGSVLMAAGGGEEERRRA